MNRRNLFTLLGIGVVIAALGGLRQLARSDAPGHAPQAVATGTPALLDFGRGTCDPCRRMMPVLEQLRERHGEHLEVRYLDLKLEANQREAETYGIKLIPTQVFVDGEGREVFRHEGFYPLASIEHRLEQLGWLPAERAD